MERTEKNIKKMFEAVDGVTACGAMDKLKKNTTEENREQIIKALMKYSIETKMNHLKSLTLIWINDLIREGEMQYSDFYKRKIESGDEAAYYAIEGYCKIMRKESYEYLVSILVSPMLDMECRALIVCELSHLSAQPFDLNTPYEKTEWNKSNLKLNEIKAWRDAGYPDGKGYEEPITHSCLKKPATDEEKVYAALDAKLQEKRQRNRDKAHPANWLIKADDNDLNQIIESWMLPENYLDFLKKASPLNVEIDMQEYGLTELLGAGTLVEGQYGYSEGKDIEGWPKNYIVIATCYADPFCIDISQENSPVYFAEHGMGEWDFEISHDTFLDFLKDLL